MRQASLPSEAASVQSAAAGAASTLGCEPYVPLRKDDLIDLVVRHGNLDASDAAQFRKLCRLIELVLHDEFHQLLERLKSPYAPFDPDSDTRPLQQGIGSSRHEQLDEFLDNLADVLLAARYYPLPPQELEHALSGSTYWGLDLQINREIFDRLLIYVRGDSCTSRVRRDLGTWFRRRVVELDVYQRLVLAVKLRASPVLGEAIDTDNVYLKMFREIPKLDLEMLLPGTRPRMRWIDTTKIGGSSLTGLYSIAKYMLLPKVAWFMVALGAFTYAFQSFLGYRRTRAEYTYSLTQQLYYQNLDNNTGVLCRVIDEAEDEQTKEAILGYYFLWRRGNEGWTPDRLGDAIEQLVRDQTGDRFQFQSREAIAKLERLGVLTREAGRLEAIEPGQALAQLAERWSRQRFENL